MSAETDATIADDEEFDEEEDENYAEMTESAKDARRARRPLAVAIVGRPNAGKSSLLNAIAGGTRAIVSPVAGTTRDAVDAVVRGPPGSAADGVGSRLFRLVDTAGIRRRAAVSSSPTDGAEGLAVGRALQAMRRADVVALVVDAAACSRDGRFVATAQDFRLAEAIAAAGRACVIVLNKWDAVPNREVGSRGKRGRKRGHLRRRGERERASEERETSKILAHQNKTPSKTSNLKKKKKKAVDRRDVRGRGPSPAPPRRVGPRRPRLGRLGPPRRESALSRRRGGRPAREAAPDRDTQYGRPRRGHVAGPAREPLVTEKGARVLRDAARDEAPDVRAVRQRRVAVPGRLPEVRRAVAARRGRVRGDGAPRCVEGQAAARGGRARRDGGREPERREELRRGFRRQVVGDEGEEGEERVRGEEGEVRGGEGGGGEWRWGERDRVLDWESGR